ncbi:ATP-grasp domain-containing protein [Oribacterium sp. P6A1]|uniref:ATP-grasp domain-containing protein n=1 Tax=Oribacterium sp. P6A1 TaxID=1410612 RepID=UPI00056CA524|nr:ATP-grasp domain-containing protein [Oribacterium sp. P6A1]
MAKQNVLVFPSATYPAMQIIDCLKNNPRFHVIAGGSYSNHAEYVCDDIIDDIPYIIAPDFWYSFEKLIEDRDIKYVIPTDETAAMLLKEKESELSAVVVCSPYETTKLCRYKSLTYEALKGERYVPFVYEINHIGDINEFPIFIKPDSSQGSKGAALIKSKEQLAEIENLNDYVLCEYLPGEEYTVDCFTDKSGKLLFCNPRVRTRLMNGITARGHNIDLTSEFEDVVISINSKIRFRGYWYLQLKRDKDGRLKLLEICTRFAGSFAISKGKGVNLPLLALCDFSGLDTEIVQNEYVVECDKTYIDRYKLNFEYNHVYIDYDDTVTSKEGKAVNPYVIAYLYECKYKGNKISLITRHKDTFNEELKDSFKRLSISESLFDEIIELHWNENKKDIIKESDGSIFIDNSFKERKEIQEALGIPVFDISNMDCLFDWRF